MIILGLLLPLIGTTIGSLLVYFMRNKLSDKTYKILLSFAAGVMFAASIWSLLLPSFELTNTCIPTCLGFVFGILFLYFLNSYHSTNHMFFAITLHNIPEGLAVGLIFASFLLGNVSLTSAFLLSIGIAIQNIPEGAIISLPMKCMGKSKNQSFLSGFLSGVVEPIFGIVSIFCLNLIQALLPFCLSFAAGAMIFVCFDELIPESRKDYPFSSIIFSLGFFIMMILDVCFG